MAEEIERYDGTVEKFIGDAVVAFFGVPVAHEDDPERAIRAALAMHRRLGELNRELSAHAGDDLAMRIGVNTGDVFVHAGADDTGLVTGECVNIAARLQTVASPGSVVVGERTYRHTREAFDFRAPAHVTVKGIDRPLAVWEVERVRPHVRETGPALRAPFVGREAEMELLRLLFARTAAEGRPNLVTIIGPPGIGKSRLTHELLSAIAAGSSASVVSGRCLPYGDGLTYWPLAEILKTDAGILDSDAVGTTFEKVRSVVEPRFAASEDVTGLTAVLLSSMGVDVPSDPLAGAEPSAARRVVERAWQRYLESLAAAGPLFAVIEDLHWADATLLDLIETLADRVFAPVLFVCPARPDLFERRPSWGAADPTR